MISKGREDELNKIIKSVNEFEADGKFKQAIKELQKVIKINAENGNVYNRLGDLYIKNNNIDEATEAFQKGVEAFRKDNFARNALALCKKILRHNPGHVRTNLDIAELLVDLDEKSDALIYYFSYIDKQLAEKNTKEVLKAIDAVRDLEVFNGKVIKKINEVYKILGRNDLAKKFAEQLLRDDTVIDDITVLGTSVTHPKAKPPEREEVKKIKKEVIEEKKTVKVEPEPHRIELDTAHLDDAVDSIESAVAQLRKAMRLDEVVVALEGSLTSLSNEHKKAIALMQKSLHINLTALEGSIKEFHESSHKNMADLEPLLRDLSGALSDLSKNQATFTNDVNTNLKKMSDSFNATTRDAMRDVNKALGGFQKASSDMCSKMEETKECTGSMLGINEEIKVSLQQMNDSMLKFMMAQELKEKKQGRFAFIIIIIVAIICGLLLFSIIF